MSESENTSQIYNMHAQNRFEFEIERDGQSYDVPQTFKPLSDERYIQWLNDLSVRSNANGEVEEKAREATAKLWDDVIADVENIDYDEGTDYRPLFAAADKIEAMNNFLAVSVVSNDGTRGRLRLGAASETQVVRTECWFNGEIVEQTHVLRTKTFELEKEYDRIQAKRTKRETTRGLRRQAKVEYIPQDEALGKLYDSMSVSVDGFTDGEIPLRFKTLVMNYVFAPSLKAKTAGK